MGKPVDDYTTVYSLSLADDEVVVTQDVENMEYTSRKHNHRYK